MFQPLHDTQLFCNDAINAHGTLPIRPIRMERRLNVPGYGVYICFSTTSRRRHHSTRNLFIKIVYPMNIPNDVVVPMIETALRHYQDLYARLRRHCGLRRIWVQLGVRYNDMIQPRRNTRGMANRHNFEVHRIFAGRPGWRVDRENNQYIKYEPASMAENAIPIHGIPAPLN